nr:ribosomal protein S18-alanine N-acetyltransferase [Syntrophus gentianae]
MTLKDLDEVLAIEQASFSSPWTRNMFVQELSISISRSLTLWMILPESSLLVGYMICWIVAGEVHLQKIAVKPESRRRHRATCLMKALFQSARDERCRSVVLEVRRSNIAAQKLYEKFGLVSKGIRRSYYSEEGEDALIMGTDLPRESALTGN